MSSVEDFVKQIIKNRKVSVAKLEQLKKKGIITKSQTNSSRIIIPKIPTIFFPRPS